jgi:hypothetical protein
LGQHLFRSVRSVQIHLFHSFFPDHHNVCKPLQVSYFSDECNVKYSLDLSLRSFYLFFRHLMKSVFSGLTCSLCLMISLLTPIRSEVDHANASLFLSRNANSSDCSSRLISMPRQTSLSHTLRSGATFLKSPSALMDFLKSLRAFVLLGQAGTDFSRILLL